MTGMYKGDKVESVPFYAVLICNVILLISYYTPTSHKTMHYVMFIDYVMPFKINKPTDEGLITCLKLHMSFSCKI